MILDRISSPADVKKLSERQLLKLCKELRIFLLKNISQTGGHLASNLGAVELTVAIHRVFDTTRDRLVFDVGHQCYVHKALTGRKELFSTLRQFQGLSGFPKPNESEHDAFIAGHASNSVSVALGMARARTLQGDNYNVLALIGDGALTGGLSYEGMNNAGASGEPLIVILNDNGMSISLNVGAMPSHLSHLRSKSAYYQFKKWYRSLFGEYPIESSIYRFNHNIKSSLKRTLLPGSSFFEDMGFYYLGPVDGHDLTQLCNVLQWAKEFNSPVVIHVKTRKGCGYSFAEENPDRFHGVSPFNIKTGQALKENSETFSSVFGKALVKYAEMDERICAITAAMTDGTGLLEFSQKFPKRFFDVAIAEGHGVSMSAGLASQGMIPVFAVYSTFLQRGYDMLIHDIALEHLHVVLGIDRAGLVGGDGETHHGCFDVVYLSSIPGFTVLCPSNFYELRSMLYNAIFHIDTPVAVRYPRGTEGHFIQDTSKDTLVCLRHGKDVTLLSYGILINNLLDAADALALDGIEAEVWKLNKIAPLELENEDILCNALGDKDILLVLEDAFGAGCVGERIAAILNCHGVGVKKLILKNLGATFALEGSIAQLEHHLGLDAESIVQTVRQVLKEQS